ncbi:TetR family transcriptional regulator [Sphaerisporangium melleum]|uniref:TetR family transcriptional regulator n=1 Tax=Sphaerisporangium melleum TaxID=321316 RepID=A0A917R453_9ACTN|nr:TetR/AcrR family transcriptional regulator C-terminal domain-containing protein [Sphaerisporangium melleum]GGK86484.1 TetR family transcriptional regulator [Sphaerisporangium melleum]GII71516.1 TetR family transcriptional regulator [Sphaerisporangium melleum]
MGANRKPGLSRRTLVETGLRLLDEVGLDGVTVRRLAAELGVQSPALYWHVRTKQELLDAMADEIIHAAGMGPPRDGESWPHWLARRARAYRASLLAHRDGARLVATARGLDPRTVGLFEQELAAMVGLGFTPVLALHTITAVSHYVTGFVLQEQGEREQAARRTPKEFGDSAEPDLPVTLLAAIREGGGPAGERAFEHGLRVLIDGTAAALARRADGDHPS